MVNNPLLAKKLQGTITLPGDKSISHRSLMFLALAQGQATITNLSSGKDVLSTLSCLKALGVKIDPLGDNAYRIEGVDKLVASPKNLDCGNSGTTIRLLSGILAGAGLQATLVGDESLSKRPMKRIMDPLSQMGASIRAMGADYAPPLQIAERQSPINGIHYNMPMASAQVKSAVLLAGLFAPTTQNVVVEEPLPSRDHTERMLNALGVEVKTQGKLITLVGRKSDLKAQDIFVPGDISSAAFWMVGAAIVPGSQVSIQNVSLNPSRLGLIKVLQDAGASIEVTETGSACGEPYGNIKVNGVPLKGIINITPDKVPELIDEIPVLTILGIFTKGTFTLRGAEELQYKESNRLKAMTDILKALKIPVNTYEGGYSFNGNPDLEIPKFETEFATHHDHRLIMALEILNLRSFWPIPIAGQEWVSISYPAFYDTLEKLLD